MTYSETIIYDLSRITRLCAELGQPQQSYPCVHVAGTNGKGSTCSLIAAGLQSSGKRVGLFTSPHLVDWRERIRVDGQMIEQAYVDRWEKEHQALLDSVQPSYFEYLTALAFCYFRDQQVDFAVIECGLGGRLDSTNILTPVLSVITSIGLDHMALLGNTRAAIAGEKAGIIKPGVPCIIAESDDETRPVFERRAQEVGAELIFADECTYLRREQERYVPACGLTGDCQVINRQTAFCALRKLEIPNEAIAVGFAQVVSLTGIRGRWETLSTHPIIICDTGHNSHGIRTYIPGLRGLLHQYSHLRIVFGMVRDKDVEVVMDLLPREALYYWTAASTERAIPAAEMERLGLQHGLMGRVYPTIADAHRAISIDAEDDDAIFVGGSNYVIGEWLS